MRKPTSVWGWSFVAVVVVQAVVILSLEGWVFALFEGALGERAKTTPYSRTIPTYLGIFIFGFLYEIALTWDALLNLNTIQIIGLCIYNFGLMIYSSLEKDQIDLNVEKLRAWDFANDPRSTMKPVLVAVPCIIAVATVAMSFLAWKLHDEFAWTIYKNISADLKMKRRYLAYQVYIALLKFDFFFFLGFTVQFLVIVSFQSVNVEFGLTCAVIPLTIVALVCAGLVVRRENRPGMIVVIILYLGGLAYFIFKLYRIYSTAKKSVYEPAHKSMTTFAVITVVLLIITIINACICMSNFGSGLRKYLMGEGKAQEDNVRPTIDGSGQEYNLETKPLNPQPTRMAIE